MTQKAIMFIGRSGSGKGTQSDLLLKYFQSINEESLYLSTGNEFRKLIAEGDNFTSKKIAEIYEIGGRHPDFLCVTIIGNFFKNNFDVHKNVIMDGGLRSLHEAETVLDVLDFYEIQNAKVFHIDVSHAWSVDKLIKRQREDDIEAIFEAKRKWFDEEVVPAIGFLEKNKRFQFYKINGEQDPAKVHEDIIACLK